MVNYRVLEKKKVEQKEEGEGTEQDRETQLDAGIETSKQAINDKREDRKSPKLENDQNQQKENDNSRAMKDSRKKNKKKNTKRMPKKKSKVLFKPAQSSNKRKEMAVSIAKQNEFSKQAIKESLLSLVNDDTEKGQNCP
ncbi:PREDICTED: cylicin-1-like [Nicotiana attenuata]|uniref:cylicin-1-like n=1 Tax=Nicotiana attenuata TaxID=49451 RepID=UPI00090520D2|nr:PREDICTED: cylicin-1-like [Nicotiana attenuata]